MRARRPLLYLAAILGAAAWLVLRDRSAPPDLAASRKTSEPSPAPPLADPVSAERMKEPLASKDDATKAASDPADADSAPNTRPPNSHDYWIHLFDETDGSPISDAQCCVGPYDFELFQTASLEWGTEIAVRTHFGSTTFAEMAQAKLRSGADGFATVPVAADHALVVSVTAAGFIPAYFFANERVHDPRGGGHATRERALEVGLSRAASLEGTVLREAQQPVAGADVTLNFMHEELRRPRSNFETMLHQRAQTHATTDASGHFQFTGLPADVALELGVIEAGATVPLAEMEQWLDPGEARKFTWIVGARGHVHGRVIGRDGAAIADASLVLHRLASDLGEAMATTNGDGEFDLDGPAGVDLVLCVDPEDVGHAGAELRFSLVPGDRNDDLAIYLSLAAPLTVRAIDPKGNPKSPDQAQVWSGTDRRTYVDSSRGETDDERAKVVFPSIPLGSCSVRVDLHSSGLFAGAELLFDHDGRHDCVVKLEPGCSVSGSVVDGIDSHAPAVATVTLLRRRDEARFDVLRMMQSMVEPGTFHFEGLAPGTYDLVAAGDDGRVGVTAGVTLEAREWRKEVVVAMERAATLELSAPADYGSLAPGTRFTFEVRRGDVRVGVTGAPPLGRAHLNVPPGRLTIEVRAGLEKYGEATVDARAGEITRVRF